MKINRLLSVLFLPLALACLSGFGSVAQASEEEMGQIRERYGRLLETYSVQCIAKDSIEARCGDVAFATRNAMLSSSLKALLAKDAKRAKKNGIGNLDFNFLINGQDYCKAPLRIVSLKKVDNGYVMAVDNGCKRAKDYNPVYEFTLIQESGNWVIDDVTYFLTKKFTLKEILK